MATIDDKVVAMSFESSKFESGVHGAVSALDKLKESLKLPASSKGLEDVGAAAKRIDLSHIGKGVDEIRNKLEVLHIAAVAIFSNIALKAYQAGTQMVKGFTIEPLKQGYSEYVLKLNSIQTILSNTAAAGTTLDDVTKALQELNTYSDKTIYNFGQMAKNIGTFTAAGVELSVSVDAIKGIANLAALSGSSALQASTAMYQLSQAVSNGKVAYIDWISVNNAGMGGAVFQRALAQTAVAMGTLKEEQLKLIGPMKTVTIAGQSFKNSLSGKGTDGWLNAKVLTGTLAQFTGDLSDAELAAQGFTDKQIYGIKKTAKAAVLAATQVKDFFNVLSVAKETAGSGWAQTFEIIFGSYDEAKKTFTGLSNAVNGFINRSADARNKVLGDWKALGGRTNAIRAIKTLFENLGMILKPIKNAFRDIFPAKTGQDLLNLTWKFQDFADALKPSPATMDRLRRTFAGLFAVLDIGKQIIGGIFTVFGKLFGALGEGSGGFLKFTANIGDWLVKIDEALKKGNKLHNFFAGLGAVLSLPVKLLVALGHALSGLFNDESSAKKFPGHIDAMTFALTIFESIISKASEALNKFLDKISGSAGLLKPFIQAYADLLSGIGDAIGTAASNMNFDAIFQVIKTGLFASLVLMFKNFFGNGSFMQQISQMGRGLSGGILGNISGAFRGLNGSMQAMQNNIKAKTLKEIAIAIALLVASVVALSFVDPEKANKAMGSIAVLMGELLGAMAILNKISATTGFLKLPATAASLILLAAAIDVLVIAVFALSRLSWDDLKKGLLGVGVLLFGMTKAATSLSMLESGIIRSSFAIGLLAASLVILSAAVKIMGSMDLADLAKGLAGIVVALIVVSKAATSLSMLESGIVRSSFAIGLLAGSLVILSLAIKVLGSMSLGDLAKGLYGMAAGLAAMVIAMNTIPEKSMLRNAAALLVMATAMGIMAGAMKVMGSMSMQEMAKSLIALGGALAILTIAMGHLTRSLRGAATLGVIAVAMGILAPALVLMGKQKMSQIAKGLITLGGALGIMGGAAMLLSGSVAPMLAFGAAMLGLGAGLALAGAGILMIGLGLSAIAVSGPAAIGIMVAAMRELLKGLIENSKLLILGLLEIVNALADSAPKFVAALVKIINNLLDVVIKASPKMGEAFVALLTVALKVIKEQAPKIIDAAFKLIIDFLQALREQIPTIIPIAVDIIVNFLKGLAQGMGRIVKAGADLIVQFLEGIAKNVKLIIAAGFNIVVSIITGLGKGAASIVKAGVDAVIAFITSVAKQAGKLADAGFKALIAFMDGMAKAIDNNSRALGAAGARLGIAIVKGMIMGFVGMAGELLGEIGKLAGDALSAIKSPFSRIAGLGRNIIQGLIDGLEKKAKDLYAKAKEIMDKVMHFWRLIPGVNSPSRVTTEIGQFLVLGLTKGLNDTAPELYSSAKAISNQLINTFKTIFGVQSPSTVMAEIGKFVGQGFAKGLKSSQDDIRSVFTELNGMLTQAMSDARETIISEEAKLDELRKAKKPDIEAIKKVQAIITENETILKRSIETRKLFNGALKAEKTSLIGLTKDYETLGTQLNAALDKLTQLKQEKAEFVSTTTDQFGALPDIPTTDADGNPIDQLKSYMDALTNQSAAVATYKTTLEELRKLGLDDATYEKLLAEGTADQSFATQLLSGGKTAVTALNTLDANLAKVSKTLAINAAANLKKAGIDAAQGLVEGLKSRRDAIRKQMEEIARMMIKALRDELDSNSPSKKFAEIGKDSMSGLAQGFSKSSKLVTNAIVNAADDALSSMKSSLSKISDIVTNELNPSPVITPILDLTQVRSQAGELGALTNVTPITAAASYGQAARISTDQLTASEEVAASSGGTSVKFEQNNYSPKALTEIEIYRQTKNQLSQFKSTLALT